MGVRCVTRNAGTQEGEGCNDGKDASTDDLTTDVFTASPACGGDQQSSENIASKRYNFIQACCEGNNLIQSIAEGGDKTKQKITIHNVTATDDFTLDATVTTVTNLLNGPTDALFFSAPCTGGSPWQRLNISKSPSLIGKMRRHWALFRKLWKSFEVTAAHAASVGAQIYIEWPRNCAYWKHPKVLRFMQAHGFVHADFDGCMYGLVATHGKHVGVRMLKPWRIACLNSRLPQFLNLRCSRDHPHTWCEGQNTITTQQYTPTIAKLILQCVLESGSGTRVAGDACASVIDVST